jgi:hypothetical protein
MNPTDPDPEHCNNVLYLIQNDIPPPAAGHLDDVHEALGESVMNFVPRQLKHQWVLVSTCLQIRIRIILGSLNPIRIKVKAGSGSGSALKIMMMRIRIPQPYCNGQWAKGVVPKPEIFVSVLDPRIHISGTVYSF